MWIIKEIIFFQAIDKANGYVYGSNEERNIQRLLSCAVGAEFEHERIGISRDATHDWPAVTPSQSCAKTNTGNGFTQGKQENLLVLLVLAQQAVCFSEIFQFLRMKII